ncbi:hypothetical protein EG329_013574 [Mollisiaceae sp. DMI_Dod_QoI]|nr:hypothetical protein EG329_013574 [Helotiales sp. DMI_Dod_QoI]
MPGIWLRCMGIWELRALTDDENIDNVGSTSNARKPGTDEAHTPIKPQSLMQKDLFKCVTLAIEPQLSSFHTFEPLRWSINMAVKEGTLASLLDPLHAPNSTIDIEMACSLTSVEERSNRSRSSSPIAEKMSSFHSARERTERLGNRLANAGHSNTVPGHVNTWREETPGPNGSAPYQYHPPQYDPNAPMMGGQYGPARPRGNSIMMMGENSVPLSTISPGSVWPSEAQLSASYGYGIRREDGSITRLYPADELPGAHNLPPRQGPEGLIVVPPPRQVSPNRRMGAEVMIPSEVVQQLSTNRPYRPEYNYPYDATQMHIDSIVAHSTHSAPSNSVSPPPRRREKIYCDKWIHEGVCAFTQMGCKYKHEMPTDKATQLSLGLNHGLPNWYRRAYAVNLNPEPHSPPAISSPSHHARAEGSWRTRPQAQLEAPPSTGNSSSGSGGQSGAGELRRHLLSESRANLHIIASGRRSFGPIAPPISSQSSLSNNPYSSLKLEEHEDEEDDDTVTWRGRRR